MVSWWTWILWFKIIFILAGHCNGFVVDMDSSVQVNVHFSKELQWFLGGHGFVSSSGYSFLQRITRVSWWTCILYIEFIFVSVRVFINQSTNQ